MISELQTTLEDVLNRFEASGTPFHEYEVSKALRALKPAGIPWESLPVPLRAELMAFDFCEVHNEAQSSWETY